MERIYNQNLISEYYESIKEKHPNLTFEDLKAIITSPFEMLREQIFCGDFKTVRLKYLGTFLVYPKRASGYLKFLEQGFSENKVDPQEFFETKNMIEKFLKNEKS